MKFFYCKKTYDNKKIPIVKGLPLIGNLFSVTQNPQKFFVQTYQKLGPVYRVNIPGKVLTVLGGPEANQFVSQKGEDYLTNHEVYADMAKEFGEDFTIALDGVHHRRSRKTFDQFFSREKLAKYVQPMIQTTLDFSKDWQLGERLKVMNFMPKLICLQTGVALLNCTRSDYFEDIFKFFITGLKVTLSGNASKRELGKLEYLTAKNRTITFIRELINDRRQKAVVMTAHSDMLDTLLTITDENGQPLAENELISLILQTLVGGIDTAANTSSFLMYEILKNPKIYLQVRAEVKAAFTNGIPNFEDIKNMKVLRWALMETLRMYPLAFMVPRYVKHPFDFAGYRVESGQSIYIALGISHFLPEFYPEPYSFDVERYTPLRQEHKQPGAFAPFSLGSHYCAGASLAEIQIMLTVATLLYAVNLEIDPPTYTLKTTMFSKKSAVLTPVDFYIKARSRNSLVS